MKKIIFQMEVVIDTEEKSVDAHMVMDEKDFDPEVIAMMKSVVSDMTQALAIGYTKKVLSFTNSKESEVKA